MCVIIIKQKGEVMPREIAKTSSKINPHGLGIVWLDTFEVTYHKSNEYRLLLTNRPFIAHFRYATVGVVSKANTHPFRCGNNVDELLMQNGTVKGYGSSKMTDSEDLAIRLGDVPRHQWKQTLEKFDSRFVTINTRTRTFQMYNKDLWVKRGDIWYSKPNVLQDNLVATYGTLKKGESNHHYVRSAKYVGRGKTSQRYPLVINGLPFLYKEAGVGYQVEVDVFKVSDSRLERMDALEGHPRWYKREQVDIEVNGKVLSCWVYFMTDARSKNAPLHKSFSKTHKTKFRTHYTFDSLSSIVDEVDEVDEVVQTSMFDSVATEDETPYCMNCFHDLEYDGFSHYHCNGCDSWFTKVEAESSI
jgi:gamma-glutamylaminecyclotransferase